MTRAPPKRDPAVADPFEVALAHVLAMEGGWTEDPYDPGGPTNYGITLATLAAHRKLVLDSGNFAGLRQQLKQIPASDVREIYFGRYWQPCRARLLSPALAVMHFDAAVNHGVAGAARMLQEAAGVEVDGDIGPQTLAATRAAEGQALIRRYAEIRRGRYRALPHFWRFGRGWLNRVEATVKLCTTQSTIQPDGENQMTDLQENYPATTTPVSPPSPQKWWGESITVWGALITAAATVVPALGPVIGIDITGEMVRQVGTHGIEAVQALGGLFGTLMTIYGRFRATTRIGLRSVTVQV